MAEKCDLNSEGHYLSISCQRTSTMNLRKHDRYHSLIYLVKCRLFILNLPYTRSGIDNALSVCIARLCCANPFVEFPTMTAIDVSVISHAGTAQYSMKWISSNSSTISRSGFQTLGASSSAFEDVFQACTHGHMPNDSHSRSINFLWNNRLSHFVVARETSL